MEQEIIQVEKIGKKKNFFVVRIKKFQVVTFTFGLLLVNQILVFWDSSSIEGNRLFEKTSLNILFSVIVIPIIYFLQWLLVVWIASKFPREKLREKFLRHPVATLIFCVLYIADLPYRLSGYLGSNIVSIFEVVVYYAIISFLWWLLVCWISEKIFKKQKLTWSWYKKIVDRIFYFLPPIYKFILGLIVALIIFLLLSILFIWIFHYSGSDLRSL